MSAASETDVKEVTGRDAFGRRFVTARADGHVVMIERGRGIVERDVAVEMDQGGSSDGFQKGRSCQVRAGEESSAEVVREGHGWGGWEGGVGVGEGLDGEGIGKGVGGQGGCGKGADVENG